MTISVFETMSDGPHRLNTPQKALKVNLARERYGTFAEIGAGQEVVRWFFKVGGAAGTIAKSISAYDMQVSDAIYGECDRYVSRDRLESMLEYEYDLNIQRLQPASHGMTAFFVFADTVVARSFRGDNECHGWLGIRFQAQPGDEDSQVVLHVRMLDSEAVQQQEALGVVGVNLIYGAFFLSHDLDHFIASLLDGLSSQRVEIDMIEFSGIEFRQTDNRLMSLKLVQLGLSMAAMFGPGGKVLQPSEVLHNKPVLVQRGSFRPPTNVHACMQNCALARFESELDAQPVVSLMEITMRNLMDDGNLQVEDFIDRAEILTAMGSTVLISDYSEYYRLTEYLSRQTRQKIGLTLGAATLRELFDEKYYGDLDGGILEAFGRLFKHNVTLYVYPMLDPAGDSVVTMQDLKVPPGMIHIYRHLAERGCLQALDDFDRDVLPIYSKDVLRKIRDRDLSWESMVPPLVAEQIKGKALFGFRDK